MICEKCIQYKIILNFTRGNQQRIILKNYIGNQNEKKNVRENL